MLPGGNGLGGGGAGMGGAGMGGAGARGCLFGRRLWWSTAIDDERATSRPPLPGVAALGLAVAAFCLLAFWFLAR
jgi:hypothetical protein